MNRHFRKLKGLVLLFFMLAGGVGNAFGNMAAPSQGGNPLLEPRGIKNIDILREDLTVDLSSLAATDIEQYRQGFAVEAVYRIKAAENVPNLELVFVILTESEQFQLFLDERRVETFAIENKELHRDDWKEPHATPFEDGSIMYNPNMFGMKSAKFTLDLTKGEHTLKARYKAFPTVHQDVGLTKGWQFAYSLAPAREWKSFGGLNLKIKYPNGWKIFTNLPLEKTENELRGEFAEIPADYLALTTQAPVPAAYRTAEGAFFYLLMASLFVPPILIGWYGVRKKAVISKTWAYGLLFGFLCSIFTLLMNILAAIVPSYYLPPRQAASYGYGDLGAIFLAVISAAVAFTLGAVVWWSVTAWNDHRLAR